MKLFATFVMLVFCVNCHAQDKTEQRDDSTKLETLRANTSYGPSSAVRTIEQDRKGNVWIASAEGIIRYDGISFTNLTDKLSSDRFFSVLEDKNGTVWFGSYGSGVYSYDGRSFRHFTTTEGLPNNDVFTIYEDKAGNMWFGTRGGVSRYNGKSFQNFTINEGLPDDEIFSIIEDKSGKFWFGTRGGACTYDGRTFTVFTRSGQPFRSVWSVIEDRKGNIWLGGTDGLWRYDGSTFTTFTQSFVGYVYQDKKENIWIVGGGNHLGFALSRFDAASLSEKKTTATEITQSRHLFTILENTDGSIWFGGFDGVYRFDGKTVKDFKNDKQ